MKIMIFLAFPDHNKTIDSQEACGTVEALGSGETIDTSGSNEIVEILESSCTVETSLVAKIVRSCTICEPNIEFTTIKEAKQHYHCYHYVDRKSVV